MNMILIGTIISFVALLEDIMTKDAVVRFDQSFGQFCNRSARLGPT